MSDLKKVLEGINAKFGKTSKDEQPLIYLASERPDLLETSFYECNVPQLNDSLGGGFAKKAIHLLSGAPGAGKTRLSISLCKAAQEDGKLAVYINAEPPFNTSYAIAEGLDMSKLLILDPKDFGEQVVDAIYELLYDSKEKKAREDIGVIVIDSINGLIPKASIDRIEEKGSEAASIAERARLITQFLERIQGRGMLRGGCCMLLIAQQRVDIGGYGAPTIISGGKASKYMPKTITQLGMKPITRKEGDTNLVVGHLVRYDITKNGISGIPDKGEYNVIYGVGVDDTIVLWDKGITEGFIIKEGRSTYVFKVPSGDVKIDKIGDAQKYLLTNEALKDELRLCMKPPKLGHELPEGWTQERVAKLAEEYDQEAEDEL